MRIRASGFALLLAGACTAPREEAQTNRAASTEPRPSAPSTSGVRSVWGEPWPPEGVAWGEVSGRVDLDRWPDADSVVLSASHDPAVPSRPDPGLAMTFFLEVMGQSRIGSIDGDGTFGPIRVPAGDYDLELWGTRRATVRYASRPISIVQGQQAVARE